MNESKIANQLRDAVLKQKHELIALIAKRMKVSRQTEWNWRKGFSHDAKEYMAKHGEFVHDPVDNEYVIIIHNHIFDLPPTLWGELEGLQKLRASVKLLKEKERKSVKTKTT